MKVGDMLPAPSPVVPSYDTIARLVEAHLRAEIPLIDWRVPGLQERRRMLAERGYPPHVSDLILVFATISVNGARLPTLGALDISNYQQLGLVDACDELLERLSLRLMEVIRGWRPRPLSVVDALFGADSEEAWDNDEELGDAEEI
ncbi:MAG: hypothetical protein JXA74_02330 [Anaerolineae bacterium]|nr:hypothetical protein [Anaerolineae bacterium]